MMRRICVFCGSSRGADERFAEAAEGFGTLLAQTGIGVVFGGSAVGLMGVIADSALAAGGEVIGVIPEGLVQREVAHDGLADLRVVPSMHARKALMEELSDGFVALPGGLGTLDELFEILTWAQLGIHRKPCGLYNVAGFFDPLLGYLDSVVRNRLLRPEHRTMILSEPDAGRLLEALRRYEAPQRDKWLDGTRPRT